MPPRRLDHQARRHQLVAAAMPLLARHGPAGLSLDQVARRAGVTRNLLYHYFPAGRIDLVTAATQEAERQLLGEWEASAGPLSGQALQEAVSRIFDHAFAPTHAWRIHRMARAAGQSAVGEVVERSTRQVADTLAALRRPGDELPPAATVALEGYVAFAEAVLEGARTSALSRAETRRVLAQVLTAVASTE
jgi:AcrR family transcriptional regulator